MQDDTPVRHFRFFLHKQIKFDRFSIDVSIIENRRTRPPMTFWSPFRPLKIPIEAQRRIEAAAAELRTAPRITKTKPEATP